MEFINVSNAIIVGFSIWTTSMLSVTVYKKKCITHVKGVPTIIESTNLFPYQFNVKQKLKAKLKKERIERCPNLFNVLLRYNYSFVSHVTEFNEYEYPNEFSVECLKRPFLGTQ